MPKVRRDPFRVIIAGPAWMHGGTEQHGNTLAKFIDPQRVELVRFLVTNEALIDNVAIHACPRPVSYCPPDQLERQTRNVDCLISWGIDTDQWLCPMSSQARIHIAHGASDWSNSIVAGCAKTADHFVCVSKHVADKLDMPAAHTIIPNGIDTSRLTETMTREESRAMFGFDDTHHVIGFVGRLVPDKGVQHIIHALSFLPTCICALICGTGEQQHELEVLADEIAPGRVTFIATDCYLGDVYQSIDSFVMPSAHEGFCLAAAEAIWSGVPLIMTDVGLAADDIEHKRSGLIIRNNCESVADAVYRTKRHSGDARIMANRARAIAQTKYQARRMAAEYTDLIENVIESKVGAAIVDEVPY